VIISYTDGNLCRADSPTASPVDSARATSATPSQATPLQLEPVQPVAQVQQSPMIQSLPEPLSALSPKEKQSTSVPNSTRSSASNIPQQQPQQPAFQPPVLPFLADSTDPSAGMDAEEKNLIALTSNREKNPDSGSRKGTKMS
jgi:hypothetical protein